MLKVEGFFINIYNFSFFSWNCNICEMLFYNCGVCVCLCDMRNLPIFKYLACFVKYLAYYILYIFMCICIYVHMLSEGNLILVKSEGRVSKWNPGLL